MKAVTALKKDPPKFSIDASARQWVVLVLMFIFLFVLPIVAVNWESQPVQQQADVLGVSSDSSRYITLPIINFKFDTTFQEPATISFTIGTLVIVVALTVLVFVIRDYRKKEYKYS